MKPDEIMMNTSKFTTLVENAVISCNLSYIDAVVHVCEMIDSDPEDVKKWISRPIKSKLESEAMDLNYLERQQKLTFE